MLICHLIEELISLFMLEEIFDFFQCRLHRALHEEGLSAAAAVERRVHLFGESPQVAVFLTDGVLEAVGGFAEHGCPTAADLADVAP